MTAGSKECQKVKKTKKEKKEKIENCPGLPECIVSIIIRVGSPDAALKTGWIIAERNHLSCPY